MDVLTLEGQQPALPSGRSALAYLHQLLQRSPGQQPDLETLLAELAGAFGVLAAGLVGLPEGVPFLRHPKVHPGPWPWQEDPDLITRVGQAPTALTLLRPEGGSLLLTHLPLLEGAGWLLWLESEQTAWSDSDAATLTLAGSVLARRLRAGGSAWAEALGRAVCQQRLETAALVTRRLAHDFGNVLTGILGFTELALAQQVAGNTPLHTYLQEVYRGAQAGAQFTHQLRLFSRRQSASARPSSLALALADEETRVRPLLNPGQHLQVVAPDDLPPAALDGDTLRQVLAALLDNAREALAGPGSIIVSARLVELSNSDCQDLFGSARPGRHLEVCVADTGSGLSPEAQRRLFAEPFFTTKPRRRGFGLAISYGLLHAHQGGLRLYPGEGGVVARVVVPVAQRPLPEIPPPATGMITTGPERAPRGERVLVVDDDPLILELVTTTLERAGYRVAAASSSEEAQWIYFASSADPFRLLLSDVVMPGQGGVDLVKRLLKRDGGLRVLFMSGHVSTDFLQTDFAQYQIDLINKPFRPEGLVRAVRAALDRPVPRRPAPVGPSGGGAVVSSSR